MRKANKIFWILLAVIVISVIGARVFLWSKGASTVPENNSTNIAVQYEIETIPAYSGDPYIEIDNNQPSFSEGDLTSKAFEHYSELDSLGRCGPAYANVGPETMPEEERGPIGEIHPSGWQVANYHELIDGNYLYNRCHLIAFSLTGENANEKNLITGTRYLNTEGMHIHANKTRPNMFPGFFIHGSHRQIQIAPISFCVEYTTLNFNSTRSNLIPKSFSCSTGKR